MAHEHYQSCIDACNAGAEACSHCAVSCLFEPERDQLARCIHLDMDCAEICRIAAAYMARNSELALKMCSFCAGVCDLCAEECDRHSMEHCRLCAEACDRCAQECRRMVAMTRTAAKPFAPRKGTH